MSISVRLQTLLAAKPKNVLTKAVSDLNKSQRSKLKTILNTPAEPDTRQQRHEAAKNALVKELLKVLKNNGFTKITQREPYYQLEWDMKKYGALDNEDMKHLAAKFHNLDLESGAARALSWFNRNLGVLVSIKGETGKSYYAIIQFFK